MKRVIKYKCDYCGDLFDTEEQCLEHEDRHKRVYKANQMLEDGCTLKQIQDECNIWYKIPEYLENVTTNNCFAISYWQGSNKPAYRIINISMNGRVKLWGCGSWNGYYGKELHLDDVDLKNPRPKEELYVDSRYINRMYY